MGHHHHSASGKNLGTAVLLNILISAGQFAGGLLSGSISLLTDALHNFSDVLSLLLSWFANRMAKKPAGLTHTFGYKRAEILAAFVNAMTLIFIAIFLIIEAVKRWFQPEIIDSKWVIYFALASIIINIFSVILLHNDAKHSLNIKSAYLHLLTDVMTSIAVLFGGLLMKYYRIYWIDSLLSVIIASYLVYSSLHILKQSMRILMQAAPKEVDLKQLKDKILSFNEVKEINKFHFWQLNEKDWYFSAELTLRNDADLQSLDNKINKIPVLMQCCEIIVKYK